MIYISIQTPYLSGVGQSVWIWSWPPMFWDIIRICGLSGNIKGNISLCLLWWQYWTLVQERFKMATLFVRYHLQERLISRVWLSSACRYQSFDNSHFDQNSILTSFAHFSCFNRIDRSVNSSMNFALSRSSIICDQQMINSKKVGWWKCVSTPSYLEPELDMASTKNV